MMVKEEEVMAEAGGGGGKGYMDMLGLGEEAMADYFLCLSPSTSSAAVSTTTTTSASTHAASPTCASYLQPPPAAPYQQHVLSFGSRAEQQYHGGGDVFGFQYYYAGGPAAPAAAPRKSSPTTECSSSISSMSSSPTATAASAISTCKPQPAKKRGSRGSSDQRKAAPPAASTNKRPKVRKERLGERILALQQLVSPFGKTDTASVLHEALGYIRFLHDQVQVLSSPYIQRLPPSSAPRAPPPEEEPRAPSDLRSRGLCLVPVACTDHLAGRSGNGGDVWSSVPAMGLPATVVAEEDAVAAGMLRGDRDHHPRRLA